MSRTFVFTTCLLIMSLGGVLPTTSLAVPGDTSLVSERDPNLLDVSGNRWSRASRFSVSSDGRYVTFQSAASNLVPGDTNAQLDIFVRDTQAGATTRVSVSSSGTQANGDSQEPSMSADGRYVAFWSNATNLVFGDTNSTSDVFVHDLQTGSTIRASVGVGGVQGNGASGNQSALSADGRYVAFRSVANNLVPGDTNGFFDIFVRDVIAGVTSRVSTATDGTQTNEQSYHPSLSADGRYVAFTSFANTLVVGDTNGQSDAFVRDTQENTMTRVSVDNAGTEGNNLSSDPAISSDGRYVAFWSRASNLVSGDSNGRADVFVRDRDLGTTMRVSLDSAGNQGNGDSWYPDFSPDSRNLVYYSAASNLVNGDTNGQMDVFVVDRQTGATSRVSVDSNGAQGNRLSADPAASNGGRFVSFWSVATNLIDGDLNGADDVFVRDTQSGLTAIVSQRNTTIPDVAGSGASDTRPFSVSSNGRYVAFSSFAPNLVAGDTNGRNDVFVRDTQTGVTTRVSVSSAGAQSNNDSSEAAISADGRYVAFDSLASNLVPSDTNSAQDVFVHDTQTGTTSRVTLSGGGAQANSSSGFPALSADGRFVAFESAASNLVVGDTNGYDIFVRDRSTGTTHRVSVDSTGAEGNGASNKPSISADGRFVAFHSVATNLVSGDTNGMVDVFVHDTQVASTVRASIGNAGTQGNNYSQDAALSADGRYVLFLSAANNLVADDANGFEDTFVRDLSQNATTRVSVDSAEIQGNRYSFSGAISAHGRFVAFSSYANNLVSGDTNALWDTFVRDQQSGTTLRISVASDGTQGNGDSERAAISADGRFVVFRGAARNLIDGDLNDVNDVFIHELGASDPNNPPVATPASVSTPANTSVAIALTGSDIDGDPLTYAVGSPSHGTLSGLAPNVTYTPSVGYSGADSFAFTANDGVDTSVPATVSISVTTPDTTPPSIAPSITGTGGTNGWYVANVGVTWTVVDGESSIGSSTGCEPSSVSSDTAGLTLTCVATSVGGTTTESVTIRRDATAPAVVVTTPTAGAEYEQGSSTLAAYTCSDATAGVVSCAGPVSSGAAIDTGALGAKTFVVTASDSAGNTTTVSRSYTVVSADHSGPVVTPTIVGTLGTGGWCTSGVEVTWAVDDPESEISNESGCERTYVIEDTAATTLTCAATSFGGTTANSVTIKKDASPPAITWPTPSPSAGYALNEAIAAEFSCTDAGSGVDGCEGTVSDGAAVDTTTLGAHAFEVAATDAAGNSQTISRAYRVVNPGEMIITTVAGGGPIDSVPALAAGLENPSDVTSDRKGNRYIIALHRVFKVTSAGDLSVVAGNGSQGFSGDGGLAIDASFNIPQGIAVDSAGNLYIADTQNGRVRRVDATSGIVTTYAGGGGSQSEGVVATSAFLSIPAGLAHRWCRRSVDRGDGQSPHPQSQRPAVA